MPYYDEEVLKDFDEALARQEVTTEWLKKMYNQQDVTTIINKTQISLLLTGSNFLIDNLRQLKQLYLLKAKK